LQPSCATARERPRCRQHEIVNRDRARELLLDRPVLGRQRPGLGAPADALRGHAPASGTFSIS
jgi:hypothetical protein